MSPSAVGSCDSAWGGRRLPVAGFIGVVIAYLVVAAILCYLVLGGVLLVRRRRIELAAA